MKNISGIVGAILGAIIGVIPWLALYVYGNYMLSILAAFIAIGANFFYRKFGGEVNKSLPTKLTIISVLTITLVTFLVVPSLLILKENYPLSMESLNSLYSNSEFMTALTHDLIISIIFTILGIIPVTNEVKREVGIEVKSDINAKTLNDNIARMKEIFQKYNSFDKENLISYEDLESEFKENDKKSFRQLKSLSIIKKYKGKYYFSEANEKNRVMGQMALAFKIVMITILVTLLLVLLIVFISTI